MLQARRRVQANAVIGAALFAALLAESGTATVLAAQSSGTFFRRSDAVFLGEALATAALASLFDGSVASRMASTGTHNSTYHRLGAIGASVGGVGPIALSAGMFAAGHLARRSTVAALGKWGLEAVAISGSATLLIKGIAGRKRPSSAAGDVDNYGLGRGFGNDAFASFPSGHTSAAFAVATVLARGTADERRGLHYAVAGLAYGAATLIGVSRLYANRHWGSDVLVGAAVGVTSGLAVVRSARPSRPRSFPPLISAAVSHTSFAPAPGGGMTVAFSLR